MKRKFTKTEIYVQSADEQAYDFEKRLQKIIDGILHEFPNVVDGIGLQFTASSNGCSTCYMVWNEERDVIVPKFANVTYDTLITRIPFSARTMSILIDLVKEHDNGMYEPATRTFSVINGIDPMVISTRRGAGKQFQQEINEAIKAANENLKA